MQRRPTLDEVALYLALAASVVANVADAERSLRGVFGAVWPPLALAVIVELWRRSPPTLDLGSALMVAIAVVVGGIAAWESWAHQVAFFAGGHDPSLLHMLEPVTVDGLAVYALLYVARRRRAVSFAPEVASSPATFGVLSVSGAEVEPLTTSPGTAPETQFPEPEPVVLAVVAAAEPAQVAVVAVEPEVPASSPTDERRAQARELYASGWTKVEIATHLGVSTKTISRDLADFDPTQPGAPSSNGHHEPAGANA